MFILSLEKSTYYIDVFGLNTNMQFLYSLAVNIIIFADTPLPLISNLATTTSGRYSAQ